MNNTLSSPAKLNLFLAVTGRRADGFHNLVSVVSPVEFGDTITVESRASGFSMECDEPSLVIDESNLVLRAARAYATAAKWTGGAHFKLQKRIPMGAGLGGGSSNATTVLLGLDQLAGNRLSLHGLQSVASGLGSDCALFLTGGAVLMRGRGEQVEALPSHAADRLAGRRVLIFKPSFSISTVWAYQTMATTPSIYLPDKKAEERVGTWINDTTASAEDLMYNNMEVSAFAKYVVLPVLLQRLRSEFGLTPRMSGSGSACFTLLSETSPVLEIKQCIQEILGAQTFIVETRLV